MQMMSNRAYIIIKCSAIIISHNLIDLHQTIVRLMLLGLSLFPFLLAVLFYCFIQFLKLTKETARVYNFVTPAVTRLSSKSYLCISIKIYLRDLKSYRNYIYVKFKLYMKSTIYTQLCNKINSKNEKLITSLCFQYTGFTCISIDCS